MRDRAQVATSEPGTAAAEKFIPLSVPEICGNEWKYVKECLDTNWVSSAGPFVDRFERMVAEYIGVDHSVATSSGTAALHIALLVSGVRQDDEVLVPTLTFIAPANAVRYVGAWPVFMDVEPDHWQMDAVKTCAFLDEQCKWTHGELRNKETGRRVKGILPVHLLGHPVDMDPLMDRARRYDLAVIEDATESLGAKYKDVMAGRLGHIACFSFNGNKVITTGGGGMIVTNRPDWAREAKYLTTQAKDDPVEHVHNNVGYNYRLSNIQAALGSAQMEQLDDFIFRKRRVAAEYSELLREFPGIRPMRTAAWAWNTSWLYTVLVDEAEYGMNSRDLMRWLGSHQVQARPLWQPLHRSKAHHGSEANRIEVADVLHRDALSLPCSAGLASSELERVVSAIRLGFDQRVVMKSRETSRG
jgi:perosamine synthetase